MWCVYVRVTWAASIIQLGSHRSQTWNGRGGLVDVVRVASMWFSCVVPGFGCGAGGFLCGAGWLLASHHVVCFMLFYVGLLGCGLCGFLAPHNFPLT